MKSIRRFVLRQAERISKLTRGILKALGTLLGIHSPYNKNYEFGQLSIAFIIFILGVPVGLLFFTTSFNPATWMAIVLSGLCLVNLDQTLFTITTMVDYGVDNNVIESIV